MTTATRHRRTARARRVPVLPIAGAVVGLLAVVAIAVTAAAGSDDDSGGGAGPVEQTRPVELAGGTAGAPVGQPAPTVDGQTFDGTPVVVGRPNQLVLFLAHWCPHCRAEVPVVQSWLDGDPDLQGVELVAVSTNVNPNAPNYSPSAWLEREGWTVPTMADDDVSTAAAAYGVDGFPFFVAIDGDGRVVARTSGELPIADLEALVAAAAG